jgi:hypothetical protein
MLSDQWCPDGDNHFIPALACLDIAALGEQPLYDPQQGFGRNAGGKGESQENPAIRPIQASHRSEKTHRRYGEAEDDRDEPPQNRNVDRLAQTIFSSIPARVCCFARRTTE